MLRKLLFLSELLLGLRICPQLSFEIFSFFDLYLAGVLKDGGPYSEGGVKVRRKEHFSSIDSLNTLPNQIPAATSVNEIMKCTEESVESNRYFRLHLPNCSAHRQQAALETNRKKY